MELFTNTVDTLFHGPVADEAKLRAQNMAEMFNYKINYFIVIKKDLLNSK
jgi:hemoglobin